MKSRRVSLPAAVAATTVLLCAAPAVAHQAPPLGECTSVELIGHQATMQITGPADVEAWIKLGDDDWVRTAAVFDGEYVESGYRWVEGSATVTKILPIGFGDAEFRLAVWSANGRDDSCWVAVAEDYVPAGPPPAPPEVAAQTPAPPPAVAPAVAPRATTPPARVAIRKTGPRRARAGGRATYRIRVTNASARRVRFTLIDRLPADVVLTTRRRGWVIRGRAVRIPMVLRPNQTRTITIPARVLATAKGRRCNVAVIRGPEIVNRRARTCARVARRVGPVLPRVTG